MNFTDRVRSWLLPEKPAQEPVVQESQPPKKKRVSRKPRRDMIIVGITKVTHGRLTKLKRHKDTDYGAGFESFDTVITRLLDEHDKHREIQI